MTYIFIYLYTYIYYMYIKRLKFWKHPQLNRCIASGQKVCKYQYHGEVFRTNKLLIYQYNVIVRMHTFFSKLLRKDWRGWELDVVQPTFLRHKYCILKVYPTKTILIPIASTSTLKWIIIIYQPNCKWCIIDRAKSANPRTARIL